MQSWLSKAVRPQMQHWFPKINDNNRRMFSNPRTLLQTMTQELFRRLRDWKLEIVVDFGVYIS